MAKTIAEMAEEYANSRYSKSTNVMFARESYEDGANAVLDELDKICFDSTKDYEERYLIICDKIRELKGE